MIGRHASDSQGVGSKSSLLLKPSHPFPTSIPRVSGGNTSITGGVKEAGTLLQHVTGTHAKAIANVATTVERVLASCRGLVLVENKMGATQTRALLSTGACKKYVAPSAQPQGRQCTLRGATGRCALADPTTHDRFSAARSKPKATCAGSAEQNIRSPAGAAKEEGWGMIF